MKNYIVEVVIKGQITRTQITAESYESAVRLAKAQYAHASRVTVIPPTH